MLFRSDRVKDMEERIVGLSEKISSREKRLKEMDIIRNGMRTALNDTTNTNH